MLVILRMKLTVEAHGLHISFLHLFHRGAHGDVGLEFIAKVRLSELHTTFGSLHSYMHTHIYVCILGIFLSLCV